MLPQAEDVPMLGRPHGLALGARARGMPEPLLGAGQAQGLAVEG